MSGCVKCTQLSLRPLAQADINQSADEFEAQLLAQRRENEVRVNLACLPASINAVVVVRQPLHLSAG